MDSEYARLKVARDAELMEVRKKYDELIRQLQESCPHEKVTDWLIDDRGEAKLCRRCMKRMEGRPLKWYRKRRCEEVEE